MEARATVMALLLVTATVPAFTVPAEQVAAGHGGDAQSEAGVFLGDPADGDEPDNAQEGQTWYACDSQDLDTRVIVYNVGDFGAIERVEVDSPDGLTIQDGPAPSGWERADSLGNAEATFVATNGGIPEGEFQVFQTPVACPDEGADGVWDIVTTHAAGPGGASTEEDARHAWGDAEEDALRTGVDGDGAPTIDFLAPNEGEVVADDPVLVDYDVSDFSLESVSCDVSFGSVTTCGESQAELSVPESSDVTFTLNATDEAGQEASKTLTFTVDRDGAPDIDFLSPDEGEVVADDPVLVDYDVSDFSLESISCDVSDGSVDSCGGSQAQLSVPEGGVTFTLTAADKAGQEASAALTLTVDRTEPSVEIQSPTSGAVIESSSVPLEFDASDNVGIESTECSVDGGDWNPCSSGDTFVLADGDHTLSVRVEDGAGLTDEDSVSFTVDTLEITSPDDGAVLQESPFQVNFTVDDETGTSALCKVDGQTQDPCSSPFDISDAVTVEEKQYNVTVEATDSGGNTNSETVSFEVATKPTIDRFTIVEDDGDWNLSTGELSTTADGKVFQVDYAVSDDLSAIDSVELAVDSRNGTQHFTSSSADDTFKILPTADGDFDLTLTAVDEFGNERTETKTAYVDAPDDQIWALSSLDLDTPNFVEETNDSDYIVELDATGFLDHEGRSDDSIYPRYTGLDLTVRYYDGNDPTEDGTESLANDTTSVLSFKVNEEPQNQEVTLEHGTGWYTITGAIVDDEFSTTSTDTVVFKVEKSTTQDGETTVVITVKDAPSKVPRADVDPPNVQPDGTLTTEVEVEDLNGLDDVAKLVLEYRRDVGEDGVYADDVEMATREVLDLETDRNETDLTVDVKDDARTNATVTHTLLLEAPIEDDASYYVNVSVVPGDEDDIAWHRTDYGDAYSRDPVRLNFSVGNEDPGIPVAEHDLDGPFFPDADEAAFFVDAEIADANFGTFADASPDSTEPTEIEAVLEKQDEGSWAKVTETGWTFRSALPGYSDTDGNKTNATVTLDLQGETRDDLSELLGETDVAPGVFLVDPPEGATEGDYRVSLTVTDDDGATGTNTVAFTVADVPEVTDVEMRDDASDGDDLLDPGQTGLAAVTVEDADGLDGLDSILLRIDATDAAGDETTLEIGGSDGPFADGSPYFQYDVDTSSLDGTNSHTFELDVGLPAELDDEADYELTAVAVPSEVADRGIDGVLVDDPPATCESADPTPEDCRNANTTTFEVANIDPAASFADQTDDGRLDALRVDNQFYALEDRTGSEDNEPNTQGKVYIFPTVEHSVQAFIEVEDENWGLGDEPTTEVQNFTVTVRDDATGDLVGSAWDVQLLNENELGVTTTSPVPGKLVVDLSTTERSAGEVAADLEVTIPENANDGTYNLSVSAADEQGSVEVLDLTLELEPWFKLDVDDQVDNAQPGIQLESALPGKTAEAEDRLAVSATGNIGVDSLVLDVGTFTSESTNETIGPGNVSATLVALNGDEIGTKALSEDGTVQFTSPSDADLFGAGETVHVELSLDVPLGTDDADYTAPVDVTATRGLAR